MSVASIALPHVFTLTGNLLAERTLHFERWTPGRTQRAARETFQVGGKGINVSKMLRRLHVPNTALCFTGGGAGTECTSWLREHGFAFQAFATTTPTRAGTVVRDASGGHAETTFLGPDAPPDAAAIRACADFLESQPAGQVLAICGSLPGWNTSTFEPLRHAIERWGEKGDLIVDTYGPPLAALVRRPLALLKINADELKSLPEAATDDLPPHVREWIVTDGPRTVRVGTADGAMAAFTPPTVREVSPTGSGDVLLACVIEARYVRKLSLKSAVAFAIPYAAANAAHPGVAEFPLPEPSP